MASKQSQLVTNLSTESNCYKIELKLPINADSNYGTPEVPPLDMDAAIAAIQATESMPRGSLRNQNRDFIFQAMAQLASQLHREGKPFKLYSAPAHVHAHAHAQNGSIGHVLATIATIYSIQAEIQTTETIQLITGYTSHPSNYVSNKAKKCMEALLMRHNLPRPCLDAAAAAMRNIIRSQTTGKSSSSTEQPLLYWALDALLECARVDEDSFMGCMIGHATGDAVGLPIEGHDRSSCEKYVDMFVKPAAVPPFHRHGLTFGQYSDDFQQTRETYISVLQCKGKMDPMVYALRTAMLFQPGAYRIVGYGKTSREASQAIWNGAHYSECGVQGNGNGSVMRSSCIGVLLSGKPKLEVVQAARVMSAVTHAGPGPMDAAAAVALAARYAAATKGLQLVHGHFAEYVASGVAAGNPKSRLPACIRELLVLKDKPFAEAAARIVEMGVKQNNERIWHKGAAISTGCWQTALWAFWCFLHSPDSYVDCIAAAIAVSGDVDTTAATVGGIIGARVGLAAVPAIWKEQLHDRGEWVYSSLRELGKKTFLLVDSGSVVVAL